QVEAAHARYERVDRFVVGHTGADRIGQRDAAGAVDRQQARYAECGIGTEGKRVEIVVVDATVDDVHSFRPARGTHVDGVVADEQILAFDQFNAHLLCEKSVFEVGRVVHAGRHHDDGRIVDAERRYRT